MSEADLIAQILAQQQQAMSEQRIASQMGLYGALGVQNYYGFVQTLQGSPPAPPRASTCSYCGRRVVALDGKRDETCAGCGART